MNPASYGHAVDDADSTISYSSSENWYKRRTKYSKSSNRSSAHGHSTQREVPDDGFLNDIFIKDTKQPTNPNLNHLLSERRVDQSISKFSSHLNLAAVPAIDEEVPESNTLANQPDDTERKSKKATGRTRLSQGKLLTLFYPC